MWLQLATAVVGNKEFVKCKFCSRQIEISTADSGFRTNRQFCSDLCKTKDYRKRKRTAVRMAAKSASIANIAKEVDTERTTVRRWLSHAKKREKKRSR